MVSLTAKRNQCTTSSVPQRKAFRQVRTSMNHHCNEVVPTSATSEGADLVGSVNDDSRPINHDRVAASYFCRILIHVLACVEPSHRSCNHHKRRLLTG
jgi:hypothetical protein